MAATNLYKKLINDRSNVRNVAEFVKSNFIYVFREISTKLSSHHFYIKKLDEWDRILRNYLEVFIEIMSAIGL